MIKKLLSVLVIAASLAACTKEAQNASQPEEIAGGKLIVRATSPVTRLTFTENGTGGYSTTFTDNTDHLWGYFRNGASIVNYTNTSDAQASRMFLQLDESTLSADHKSASFKSDCKVIPATATNIFFYLDNNASPITYNSTPTFCDLHSQSGKLADANLLHVIVGNTDISAMTTDTDGNKVADIAFAYKTSIIKVCITFPAGVTPTADDATTITISDSDVYNKVHISWGEPGASSTKGDISFHPESVSGQVATAYITVWENTKFDGATITAVAGGKACRADLTAAQTIEAGKVYSLSRTVQVGAFDKWTADAASSEVFIAGLTVDTNTATWLSYDASTGAVAWTENTTGKPRVGTITFTTGETVKITQIEAKDFVGNWAITCKRYAPNTNLGVTANTTAATKALTVSLNNGQTFTEGSRSITNNLNIAGFIKTYIAEACADIVYDDKSLRFGIFLDGVKAQAVNTGKTGYDYVTLLPEMGNGWTAYNFCPVPFNNSTNRGWLWFVPDDAADPTGNFHYSQSDWGTYDANGTNKNVLGLVFAKCKSATPSASDYQQPNGTGAGSAYEVIYQCNPNGVNNAPLVRLP